MDAAAAVKVIEANLWERLSFLAKTRKGAVVQDTADLLLVDSGLPCEMFNKIGRSSLHPRFAMDRIESAINHFKAKAEPFSWWIGPNSGHGSLEPTLTELGLVSGEEQWGMALSLDTLNLPSAQAGLDIKRAATKDAIKQFAEVIAGGSNPPDENIIKFYEDTADAAVSATSPVKLYIGYADNKPAAAMEVFYGQGAMGIYSMGLTAAGRGKGYMPALLISALKEAKKAGQRIASLMAKEAERAAYQRIGFKVAGKFCEFSPKKG